MADILDRIVAHKRLEVDRRSRNTPLAKLRDAPRYHRKTHDFCRALERSDNYGIIAEFKRKSPSQSDINLNADPAGVARGYAGGGAAAMSCITDTNFFGAEPSDIDLVRGAVDLPILRKDFMIESYQLHEARAMGADAILLIAACLDPGQLDELAHEACELGLTVLCEVHDEDDVAKLSPDVDIVGVNNRNLKDFTVSLNTSIRLAEMLPPGLLKISESGIEDPQSIVKLRRSGFQGFLIGTYFMRQDDPGEALAAFIRKTREIDDLYQGAIA